MLLLNASVANLQVARSPETMSGDGIPTASDTFARLLADAQPDTGDHGPGAPAQLARGAPEVNRATGSDLPAAGNVLPRTADEDGDAETAAEGAVGVVDASLLANVATGLAETLAVGHPASSLLYAGGGQAMSAIALPGRLSAPWLQVAAEASGTVGADVAPLAGGTATEGDGLDGVPSATLARGAGTDGQAGAATGASTGILTPLPTSPGGAGAVGAAAGGAAARPEVAPAGMAAQTGLAAATELSGPMESAASTGVAAPVASTPDAVEPPTASAAAEGSEAASQANEAVRAAAARWSVADGEDARRDQDADSAPESVGLVDAARRDAAAPSTGAVKLQPSATPEADAARLGEALAGRILFMQAGQSRSAEVVVDPPELGSIEIRLEQSMGRVSVAFVTQNTNTRDLLDASLARLRELLTSEGVSVGSLDVRTGDGGTRDQPSSNRPANSRSERDAAAAVLPAFAGGRQARLIDAWV